MAEIHMFLAEAIAHTAADRRPGARHALMIFATADGRGAAADRALGFAEEAGWLHPAAKRSKSIGDDPSIIEDDVLRAAAESALEHGAAIVVYAEEIRSDA